MCTRYLWNPLVSLHQVTVQVALSVFSHSQITMPLRAAARALKAKGLLNHQCVLKVLKPKSTFCSKTTKNVVKWIHVSHVPWWTELGTLPEVIQVLWRQSVKKSCTLACKAYLNRIDFPEFSRLQWWYCVDCMRFTYNTIPYHTMLYHYIHNTTQYNAIHYITYLSYLHTHIYIIFKPIHSYHTITFHYITLHFVYIMFTLRLHYVCITFTLRLQYVYITFTLRLLDTLTLHSHLHWHLHWHLHLHLRWHLCSHLRWHLRWHLGWDLRLHLRLHLYLYLRVHYVYIYCHTYVYIYVHIYFYMYVYIYVYIYAFILNYTCSILHLRVHLHTFTYTFTFTYICSYIQYTTIRYNTIQCNTIQYNTIHILFILGWHIRSSSLRQYTDDGFYIQDSKQQQRTLRLFSAFPFLRLVIFTHILVSSRQLTSAAHQIHTDSHLSTATSNTLNKLAMCTWSFFLIQLLCHSWHSCLTLVYLFVRVLPCRTWLLQNSLQGFGHRVRLPRLRLRHGVHSKLGGFSYGKDAVTPFFRQTCR